MTKKRGFWTAAILTALICSAIVAHTVLQASKVTRANFCSLQKGMTSAEVEAIFGERPEPWIFNGSHVGGEVPLMWTGDGTAHIMFDEHRGLLYKCWTEPGFSSPTKVSFNRVVVGMTIAEVNEIFGKPPDTCWHSSKYVSTSRWHDIDGCGGMDFDSGRLRRKWWEGGGAERGRIEILFGRILRFLPLN
jgi:hypothetical protein